jgi:hypothetical protein
MVLQGGLGNQLFIYFAARFIEENYQKRIVFISHLPNRLHEIGIKSTYPNYVFPKIALSVLSKIFGKLSLIKISSRYFHFCVNVGYENLDYKIKSLKFLSGYFQSTYYIENSRISKNDLNDIKVFFSKQSTQGSNYTVKDSIAVHIRRGDYLLEVNKYFGLLSHEYYSEAIASILSLRKFDRIYLFSDSPISPTIKSKLKITFSKLDVVDTHEHNIADVSTLKILSYFEGHVISNSTFSWWGAYLANNNKIVVAPNVWFKHHLEPNRIYPESWITAKSAWE